MRFSLLVTIVLLLPNLLFFNDMGLSIGSDSRSNQIIIDPSGNGDFTTIQDGIYSASDGDSILIMNGSYYEELTISKAITITGISNDGVILSGSDTETGISLESEDVTISNMKIINFEFGIIIEDQSDNIQIYDNNFAYNGDSIRTFGSNNNLDVNNNSFTEDRRAALVHLSGDTLDFMNNDIIDSNKGIEFSTDSVIIKNNNIIVKNGKSIVGLPKQIKIINNTLRSNSNCIEIEGQGVISDNEILSSEYGIFLRRTGNDVIYINNNTISNSERGISSGSSSYVIEDNSISNCSSYGMYMLGGGNYEKSIVQRNEITNSNVGIYYNHGGFRIENNEIKNHQCGIELVEAQSGIISTNLVINNKKALQLSRTSNNQFFNNWFENNTIQVTTDGEDIWNRTGSIGGNYWSDYTGYDRYHGVNQNIIGSDGFGDTPYYIDAINVDKYPIINDIQNPVAFIESENEISQGETAFFDGKNSSDNNQVTSYEWEFIYDSHLEKYDQDSFHFKFDNSGIYIITLNVSDFAGNWDEDSISITVIDTESPTPVIEDITIPQDKIANFNSSQSTDNEGIVNTSWSFSYQGESYTLFGVQCDFLFEIPGYYNVTLTVIDEQGNFGKRDFLVKVIDVEDPIADAGEDLVLTSPVYLTLSGSQSYDNGIISNYSWKITYDDDLYFYYGEIIEHDFSRYGTYFVKLEVSDEFGNIGLDEISISLIDNISPTIVIDGEKNYFFGEAVVLDVSRSSDNNEIDRISWTLFDQTLKSFDDPVLNYTYQTPGTHRINVSVWDISGNVKNESVYVTITDNIAPIANCGDDRDVILGEEIQLHAGSSSDNYQILKYSWTVNEGEKITELDGAIVNYMFSNGGLFEIVLTVYDYSNNTDQDQMIVNVISNSTLKGIIIDSDEKPLSRVKITVHASDNKKYLGETNEKGEYEIVVPHGSYTWELNKDGYEHVKGEGQINPGETLPISGGDLILNEESSSNAILIAIIIIIICLIILIIIAVFIILKKKGRSSETEEVTDSTDSLMEEQPQSELLVNQPEPLGLNGTTEYESGIDRLNSVDTMNTLPEYNENEYPSNES